MNDALGETSMTAIDLLARARANYPDRRFARSFHDNAIGEWKEALGRFVMLASLAITGQWVHVPCEILANGKPLFAANEWIE